MPLNPSIIAVVNGTPAAFVLAEIGGPTALTMGTIADGKFLKRVGTEIVGVDAPGGGVSDGDKGDIVVSVAGTVWLIDAAYTATVAALSDPVGTSTAAIAAHLAAGDPHAQYALESAMAAIATSGSASDLTTGTLPIARIADGTVTLAKLADVATARILGRTTGGPGVPEALTAAQAKTVLSIANTDVSGLGTLSTQSGTFSGTSSGTNTGDSASEPAGAVATHAAAGDPHPAYALESSLGPLATIADAPSNGSRYGRKNGAWDVIPAGGAVTITAIETDLGATPKATGTFSVTDATVSPTSKILIWQAPGPYTGKGTGADECELDELRLVAVPGSGSFVVGWQVRGFVTIRTVPPGARAPAPQAVMLGLVRGNFKFHYTVG